MASSDAMACRELEGLVPGYISETLPRATHERFQMHLASCGACATYLARMRNAAALSCQELVELVTEYLDGRLPPTERQRFEDHLALCDGCRTYLEQMRETIRLTGQLTEETIAPEAREKLLAAFRNWKTRR